MHNRIRWVTQTAILLALLVALQALTKGFGQLVTGSCVNALLAISVLLGGLSCGITIALLSPVLAFLLGIASQVLTVPAIMAGNTVFILLLYFLTGRQLFRQVLALLAAAAAKFLVLYGIVAGLICGVCAPTLLSAGALKEPMLQILPATFSWPQLFTALIGGGIALLLVPVLRKALRK